MIAAIILSSIAIENVVFVTYIPLLYKLKMLLYNNSIGERMLIDI